MRVKNSDNAYGLVAIILHWLVFVLFFALFFLGLWMVGLTYYSAWYKSAPHIHKSLGLMLFFIMILRLGWRALNAKPKLAKSLSRFEKWAAHCVHFLLYGLLFALLISGYLISTADGRAIEVFNWFSVPASVYGLSNQADVAGWVHEYLAWAIVLLSSVHALAALKHHFIDKDDTLKKMLSTQ